MILLMAAAMMAPAPDAAIGSWKTESDNGVVQITSCGGSICGHLVTSDIIRANPAQVDGRNKDPSLRTRPLAGLPILSGFTRGDGEWTGGTIYNGEDGGTYKATVTPVDPDHLKVKGCIVWPLCKSQTWTRVGP